MRIAMPPMTEPEADRKQRLQRDHDRHTKLRLPRRSLLASGPAHDRQGVARLVGGHRHTIGRGLARYAARGLDAVLAPSVPTGTPVSLAPAGLARLEQALRRPEGCASSEALRQGVARTQGVQLPDQTRSTLVRTRFRPTLNVPRPSHTKNP